MPFRINLCGIILLKQLYFSKYVVNCVVIFLQIEIACRNTFQHFFSQTAYKLVVIVLCHFCYCRVGYFRLTEPEGLLPSLKTYLKEWNFSIMIMKAALVTRANVGYAKGEIFKYYFALLFDFSM